MKNKIALLTLVIVIFNSVFSYADSSVNVVIDDIPLSQQSLIDDYVSENISEDGYIYFSDYGSASPRSGTAVAIGGAVASSILALATKAGISFLSTNAMDEFLYRFTGIPSAQSLLPSLNNSVKNAIGGVVNFSRSILDTLSSTFFDVVTAKNIGFYKTGDMSIPVWPSDVSFSEKNIVNLSRVATGGVSANADYDGEVEKVFDVLGHKYKIRAFTDSDSTSQYCSATVYRYNASSDTWTSVLTDKIYSGDTLYVYPILRQYYSKYYIGVCFVYKTGLGSVYRSGSGKSSSSVGGYNYLDLVGTSFDAVVGDAWSDGVIADDEGSSGVSIKIPSNASQLVGVPSTGVTTNPTYDTWSPGVTVVIPGVDNPKVDITPDSGTTGGGSTDSGTTGGGSTGSGSSSISWDWLKTLLNTLLSLIQSIADWITGFWDRFIDVLGSLLSFDWLGDLLSSMLEFIKSIAEWITGFWETLFEFIKSIFVPSDGYFIGKFEDILTSLKNRVPGIDIDKLKSLAVGEYQFKDIYATFFGVKCLVVRGSIINDVVSWSRPIIQGLIAIFLLLYNYNQIYKLIRGGSVIGSTCPNSERG